MEMAAVQALPKAAHLWPNRDALLYMAYAPPTRIPYQSTPRACDCNNANPGLFVFAAVESPAHYHLGRPVHQNVGVGALAAFITQGVIGAENDAMGQ